MTHYNVSRSAVHRREPFVDEMFAAESAKNSMLAVAASNSCCRLFNSM
jgi:hypothetical protein